MTREDFIARFGGVYEGSAWVAAAVFDAFSRGDLNAPGALAEAMRGVVDATDQDSKLALVRAHPELASRARMAEASVREQSSAGLDQCSPAEFAAFQRLNASYNARFGHPFIIAVRGQTRADILEAFEARLANDPETEFNTAMQQIHKIAGLRLADLLDEAA
jgi:2-oxo-4-hydroxy-4-carboxy-5-ureidoimidazoline decarboxylase